MSLNKNREQRTRVGKDDIGEGGEVILTNLKIYSEGTDISHA